MMSLRARYTVLTSIALLIVFLSTQYYRSGHSFSLIRYPLHNTPPVPSPSPSHPPRPPFYKPESPTTSAVPIIDNFPLAAEAHSAADLPPIPSWNAPPNPHVKESTPLFIGFTRNWRLLQQVVVSYITSGWPPEDIYVVENTGVMDSNSLGLLSLQNPFFLNHTRLEMLGVNILVTPTLFTFAQLQNFYLWTATQKAWAHYYWGHMDVVSLSTEPAGRFPSASSPVPDSFEPWENRTLYTNCLQALRDITSPNPETGVVPRWASVFFSYDRLALVNVAAHKSIGAWDTIIPFYMGDCDYHARIEMAGYMIRDYPAGLVYDVASSLSDLAVLYRVTSGPKGSIGPPEFVDPNEQEMKEIEEEERKAKEKEKEDQDLVKRDEEEFIDEEREEKLREKDKDAALQASKLALLFTPHLPETHPKPTDLPNPQLWTSDSPSSETYNHLLSTLDRMQHSKSATNRGRNTWQARQVGGQDEPFYRDSAGFEQGIQMTIEHGRAVFREKWGHRDCDIVRQGYRIDDAWRVVHDWE